MKAATVLVALAPIGLTAQEGGLYPWTMRLPGSEQAVFSRPLATINALLVRPLDNGGNAAQAMKLSATAVKARADGTVEFSFNQAVGEDMRRASEEVVRALNVRHRQFPANYDVKFGFADKWGGKDGPSAAVACALLLESLFAGFEIPANLAVTGDMNADSTVQPVGGVADKIRGALDQKCDLIGVPGANEEDVTDLVVEENLRRFLSAKIFLLHRFDDAVVLANPAARTPEQQKALADLDAIQKELATSGAAALYAPTMTQRLQAIVAAMPNAYTGKILLAANSRRVPARYSLVGTLVRIDEAMAPFEETIAKLEDGTPVESFQFGRNNPLQNAKNQLGALRDKSDERFVRVIDAQKALVDQFQRLVNSNTKSTTVFKALLVDLKSASDRSKAEWKLVRDNQTVQDQLMKRGINLGKD